MDDWDDIHFSEPEYLDGEGKWSTNFQPDIYSEIGLYSLRVRAIDTDGSIGDWYYLDSIDVMNNIPFEQGFAIEKINDDPMNNIFERFGKDAFEVKVSGMENMKPPNGGGSMHG